MRQLAMVAWAAATVALGACAGGVHQTAATQPTVSYAYTDADDVDDIASTAAEYCSDTYGKDAVLLSRDVQGDRYEATYACQ